jgi:hypothetical protein
MHLFARCAKIPIVHFNVTEHPTAQWTAQQIVDAFPWDTAPRYLLRDRDSIYGEVFQDRVGHMGIEEVKITSRSPWQSPYCERVIGSIRRDALDQVIVLNERHLRRVLRSYVDYSPLRKGLYSRFSTCLRCSSSHLCSRAWTGGDNPKTK